MVVWRNGSVEYVSGKNLTHALASVGYLNFDRSEIAEWEQLPIDDE